MKRLWPLAFLLAIVGLTSALVAGGALRGGERSEGETYSTPATVILDLSAAALQDSAPAGEPGASEEATAAAGLGSEQGVAGETTSTAQAGAEADEGAGGQEEASANDEAAAQERDEAGGLAATEEQPDGAETAQTGEPEGETYTVKEGDTPFSIARTLGTSVDELMSLNGIDDPTSLQIGDVLEVPEP